MRPVSDILDLDLWVSTLVLLRAFHFVLQPGLADCCDTLLVYILSMYLVL